MPSRELISAKISQNTMAVMLLYAIVTFNIDIVSAQDPSVQVSLSSLHATTSMPIEIVESVPMPVGQIVRTISHQRTRIGIYHRIHKRFVLWNASVLQGAKFVGLPPSHTGPHGIGLKEITDGRLAKQYTFSVPDPGVYIINTEWSLTTHDMNGKIPMVRKGNPVLLFVEPSKNYETQAAKEVGEFEGMHLQSFLEKQYDSSPSEIGFPMPQFEELALPE